MKAKNAIYSLLPLCAICLSACTENPPEEASHAHDHDHSSCEHHDHGEHHGHEHVKAGPNQGRMITGINPQAEFLVLGNRKVQISFFDDAMTPVAPAGQTVTVVTGERISPTELNFSITGDVLLSDQMIPMGNNFPTIVTVTPSPGADEVVKKFTLNLSGCSSCDNKEYACECHH